MSLTRYSGRRTKSRKAEESRFKNRRNGIDVEAAFIVNEEGFSRKAMALMSF